MEKGDIAERSEGRLVGAIKQIDGDGVLGETVTEEIAEALSIEFERQVRTRMALEVQETLAGEREPEDSDGDE